MATVKIHPSVEPVTTVRHTMSRAGKHLGHFNSDLIFVSGIPMVVIEWKSSPQGDLPVISVPPLRVKGAYAAVWHRFFNRLGWQSGPISILQASCFVWHAF
jgi:hypothetical protein